jgi:hypothetical protein
MYTFEALQILIFLIPGFISCTLLDKILGRHREPNDLGRFIEALIFSLLIYVAYSFFYRGSPIFFNKAKMATEVLDWWAFALLLLYSVLLPIVLGYLNHFDLYMRLFRKMYVTSATGGRDTWGEVFARKYRSITINFKDGRRLQGWADHASGSHEQPLIYIVYPQWIVKKDGKPTFKKINGVDGLLITPEYKIKYIEFLGKKK